MIFDKYFLYECDSPSCDGKKYAVVETPLSCPYCDKVAMYDKATHLIKVMILERMDTDDNN